MQSRYNRPLGPRLNPFNIQILSEGLQSRVFPAQSKTDPALSRLQMQVINLAHQHLNLHNIPWQSKRPFLPEISGEFVPRLLGQSGSLYEHFRRMAEEVSGEYLQAAKEFSKMKLDSLDELNPSAFELSSFTKAGWYKYTRDGFACTPDGPADKVIVFDVETAPGVPQFSKFPLLASAFGASGLYLWLSPRLFNESSIDGTADLIPLERPLLVIGHHISFDRARIQSQYQLQLGPQRFLDTLSMHCAVSGISSQQRSSWQAEQKKQEASEIEDPSELEADSSDIEETDDNNGNDTPGWCKHGSLNNLADVMKLHCGIKVDKSVRKNVLLSATSAQQLRQEFSQIAQYCAKDTLATAQLFQTLFPKFMKKSPHPVTFSGLLQMASFIVPLESKTAWEAYQQRCDALLAEAVQSIEQDLLELVESIIEAHPPGQPDPIDDPWLGQLDWQREDTLRWTKARYLKDGVTFAKGGEPRLIGNAKLHQKPAWYRKLWKSGGIRMTPRTSIVPLLLKLRWKSQSIALLPEHGWCYLVNGGTDEDNIITVNNRKYRKIPHPGGRDDNVGCLLTKNFFKFFESKQLWSDEQQALIKRILEINTRFSFWIGYRERIKEQFVIENSEGLACIVPGVMPMGTVTRRAVEKTWLTAANPKEGLVGSELKSHVRAPPGWSLVGADVDSQELWIGALLGDAQFGWSGSSALGWMALQGSKSDGSDLHSRTAAILGMSRDQAKIFNYGRIYGAGVKYAAQLLCRFNPEITVGDAQQRATALYHSTKGRRIANRSDAFVSYSGGTESFMFNQMEAIAKQPVAATPVLKAQLSEGLIAAHVESEYLTSRVNWVVQSSGVDYLHLTLVAMAYLMKRFRISGRVALCIHDELRFLVRREDRLRAALALQVANLWVRAAFVEAVGVRDLPLSVAFFSAVDVDWVLRKEVTMSCKTISQPEPLSPGESFDIYRLLQECPSLGPDFIEGEREQVYYNNNNNNQEKSTSTTNEAEYLALLKRQIFLPGKYSKVSDSEATMQEPPVNDKEPTESIKESAKENNERPFQSAPNVQDHFQKWKNLIKNKNSKHGSTDNHDKPIK